LNTLFQGGAAGQLSDGELLERFVAGRDEAAEAAFAALVERHGVMVLGVCRRVLGNRDAAEDAFQATFLVLARKAAAIARREQLASWLHGVARRAALDSRARATRREAREKRWGAMSPKQPPDPTLANELRAILDEELARLPERHRAVVLLCELEGLSRRQAAARLGVSEGTVSSRLSRAKSRLRERLTRRGFALSTAALTSVLAQDAQAVLLPPVLVDSTIRVATLVAAGSSLAGALSTSVATLTEGVLKAMLLAKIKVAFFGLATLAVVSTSLGVLAQDGPGQHSAQVSDNDRLKAVESKLDRLLEVLGGSSRRVTSADAPPLMTTDPRAPMPIPFPAAATAAAPATATAAAPAPAPSPVPPVPPLGNGMPMASPYGAPAPSPAPPVPPPAPVPPRADAVPSTIDPVANPLTRQRPRSQGTRTDLGARVDHLEVRLGELERRLGELERRIAGRDALSPVEIRQTTAPAGIRSDARPTSGSSAAARNDSGANPLEGPTNRSRPDRGPFDPDGGQTSPERRTSDDARRDIPVPSLPELPDAPRPPEPERDPGPVPAQSEVSPER
jgi:RNA polymerase sigma factor (sigma-70 family)